MCCSQKTCSGHCSTVVLRIRFIAYSRLLDGAITLETREKAPPPSTLPSTSSSLGSPLGSSLDPATCTNSALQPVRQTRPSQENHVMANSPSCGPGTASSLLQGRSVRLPEKRIQFAGSHACGKVGPAQEGLYPKEEQCAIIHIARAGRHI